MTKIHLLIEDDYIEEFMSNLPKDKVVVIEHDFEENKKKLQNVLQNHKDNKEKFIPYYESMKALNEWFKAKELS